MSILSTTQLTKQYGNEPNIVKALDGVSISIEPGEFVAIIGTSGSGKSTLLNMLGGLDRPTSGTVKVDNYELGKLKDEDLTVFRRQRIGFIFQNYNLVPILNVYENIVMPIQLDGKKPDKTLNIHQRDCGAAGTGKETLQYAKYPFRRPAAEGSYCEGISQQTGHYPCRRADRKSGQQDQR